jgi:hypothetical protein
MKRVIGDEGLQVLLRRIEGERADYPDRAEDLRTLETYLGGGSFDLARYTAREILNKQVNLRSAASGLPADLQALLSRIDQERFEYPDRAREAQTLETYLGGGSFDLARYTAREILNKQANLRSAASGLPADLQALLSRIEQEDVEYLERARDVQTLETYLGSGSFDLARYTAREILNKQANLRSTTVVK